MKKSLLIAFIILAVSNSFSQSVVINEIIPANLHVVTDEFGLYEDVIELYNAGSFPQSLQGFHLSDDSTDHFKWTFPNIILQPGQFLIVFASKKNLTNSTYCHTNFTLDANGEAILLTDVAGQVVDEISHAQVPADISYGLQPDGANNFFYFPTPTPGYTNNAAVSAAVLLDEPVFSNNAGFYTNSFQLSITHPDPQAEIHYTLDGSEPTLASPLYSSPITIQSRTGDANVYSVIPTTVAIYGWLPPWYGPLNEVFKCTPVRTRVFKNGSIPSRISTRTYFVDPDIFQRYPDIPVISLVTDPYYLFGLLWRTICTRILS